MQLDYSALGIDMAALMPILVLGVLGMAVLVLGLFVGKEQGGVLAGFSLGGLLVAAVTILPLVGVHRNAFGQMMAVDNFYLFFAMLAIAVTALAVLLSATYLDRTGLAHPEYYGLLIFGAMGMLVMISASHLIMLLIGIELLSLSLYVLAGFARTRLTSEEAALKYFLLGSFSAGLLIYGIALVYGATGTLDYAGIAKAINAQQGLDPMLLIGMGLVLVGFAFKLSFVPFHMWVPDVYEGAPTPVTAYMAVGTKAAVFAAMLRLLGTAFPTLQPEWAPMLAVLAALTMIVGNVAAVVQTNIKRLLGYSSISHAGYVLIAVVAGGALGNDAALFYLVAYTVMNFGAFAVMVAVSGGREERLELSDYAGLAKRSPWLAAAMAVFMLSLSGAPFTPGFLGKLYVFSAAIQGGWLWLALVGVATSLVAFYYYLKVVVVMYMSEPAGEVKPSAATLSMGAVVVVALFFTVQLGVLPSLFFNLSQLPVAMGM
ncbi:MAG TPA: NADH-quinone oxidoreductase subunit N [Chloroflexota bacterium]|nr:NADH-quinone oxidoreductase subunit N [Chloroflexota bacterium]